MESLSKMIIVSELAGDRIVVKTTEPDQISKIIEIGFHFEDTLFVRLISSVEDRVDLIKKLVAMGALFSAGKDWSPEELMNYYKELKYITEPYNVISWSSPSAYAVKVVS